ncbi:MAG: hypothetical protein K2X47_18460, partial [Bdellovibrionales bacterium]|nr:hypothetical protein [Bdellovibrionales bacterium]
FGETSAIQETSPSYLGTTFLSDADRAGGRVRSSILNPTLGLQYTQLSGEWRGFLMGVEVGMVAHLTGSGVVPSGALHFGYSF